jgi:hypothetical protein
VEITGTLPSRATEKGAVARCGFANPLIPAVQAARPNGRSPMPLS